MKRYFKGIFEKYSLTVGPKNEVDEMMSLTFIMQGAFWHHVLDPKWTLKKYFIYHFLNIFLILYTTLGTTEIVKTATDFQIIAEAFYTLTVIVSSTAKLGLFISNRFVYRKLYITAKTTFYDLIKSDSEEHLKEVLRRGTRVVYALFITVILPVATYELIAVWNYVKGTRVLLSRSTSSLVPMTTPYFEVSFIFQSVYLAELATSMVVNDMCFVFLLYFLCTACDSLVKLLQVEPRRRGEAEVSYGRRLNEGLKKFHQAHLSVVEYQTGINEMYQWMALSPLCVTGLNICLGLVVLSKEVNWHFISLLLPMSCELFAYCWFGELWKTKANNIKLALDSFDWTSMMMKDKKSYYIIATYVSKETGVRIATGHELSLITLSSVLKFIYQAFTVLQNME